MIMVQVNLQNQKMIVTPTTPSLIQNKQFDLSQWKPIVDRIKIPIAQSHCIMNCGIYALAGWHLQSFWHTKSEPKEGIIQDK